MKITENTFKKEKHLKKKKKKYLNQKINRYLKNLKKFQLR